MREEIAEVVAHELVSGVSYEIRDAAKFAKRLGAFYIVFLALRNSPEWKALVEVAQRSTAIPALALKVVLPKVFDLLEEFAKFEAALQTTVDEDMRGLLEEFRTILEETLALWGRRTPQGVTSPPRPSGLEELLRDLKARTVQARETAFQRQDLEAVVRRSRMGSAGLRAVSGALARAADATALRGGTEAEEERPVGGGSAQRTPRGIRRHRNRLREAAEALGRVAQELEGRARKVGSVAKEGGGASAHDDLDALGAAASEAADVLGGLPAGDLADLEEVVLQAEVEGFQSLEGSEALMGALVGTVLGPEIADLARRMGESVDLLGVLTLLFPGRDWDHSIADLHRTFLGDLVRYARLLERNEDLRKMLELVGRIELEYGSRRLAVSRFGASEVHSVERSKDIQRILPVELVKLQDDTLRYLFYANWFEGNLLTYELRGRHWVGGPPTKKRKGPVVALVDTSGSMSGSPEIVAKAIILAIARRMLKQGRDVKVVLFSSVDQTTEIELTSAKRMGREFLEFLMQGFGGGTDFNTALKSGLNSLKAKRYRGADLLFVTDGISRVSDASLVQAWTKLKGETDSRIFTVIVGNDTAGGLEGLSDHTYLVSGGEDWTVESSPADLVKFLTSSKASAV